MIPALVIAATYVILLGIAVQRRTRRDPAEGWLLGYCGYSVLLMVLHALILSGQGTLPLLGHRVTLIAFVISVSLVGFLTLAYVVSPMTIGWAVISVLWLGAVLSANLFNTTPLISNQAWVPEPIRTAATLSAEITVLGWLLLALVLLVVVTRAFLAEPLPLYANRILFWEAVVPFLLLGDILSAWINTPWNFIGYGVRLLGTIGAVYGVTAHRVIDLRDAIRWFVSRSILTLVTALLALASILVTLYIQLPGLELSERWIIAIGAAFIVALVLQPARQFFQWLLRRLIVRTTTDPTEAVRRYGQRISDEIELTRLAEVAVKTVNELLATRRGFLILATPLDGQMALEALSSDPSKDTGPGYIPLESPIYRHFVTTHLPLLQYDIDYHKDYHAVTDAERRYFSSLEMDVYAPIIDDGQLIGLLALGPKTSDDPFRPSELDLLTALAQQTVVALENARLVTGLRRLNEEISALNEDLRITNERLGRLDSVKTDFIAIASHELRTPLTQIQGYADLLTEMARRHMLNPEQITDITQSLSNASQRMAEVIGSMLDVSQIDVENMDLNFVETTLSHILKLAIEPYADSIHERNQTLVARGLRGLPPIQADYRRMVQAFQNLVSNAIKFTPDGGKINITGQVYEKDEQGQPLSVQVNITDTGIGIEKQHHELIFEKFFRVGSVALHSTGSTKFKGAGPGLGLPIAKGIIEGHGGRIWVDSEGHDEKNYPGSTFHVVLPIQPPAKDVRERLTQIQEAALAAKQAAMEDTVIRNHNGDE